MDQLHILRLDPEGAWTEHSDPDVVERPAEGLLWARASIDGIPQVLVDDLAERLDLHHLAVEDALNPRQRPKIERFDRHLFVVLHQLDLIDGQLEPVQLACFVGTRFVLVLHAGAGRSIEEAERRIRNMSVEMARGSEVLMHSLFDTIVDGNEARATDLEAEVELLEEVVLQDPSAPVQREIYSVKQRLARLRRYAIPVGKILDRVVDPRIPPVLDEEVAAYFRDVHDHALRLGDQVHSTDDLTTAILDLLRNEQVASQNEVTKKLTSWAAIIAVPTLVSSVYGMNFSLLPADGSRFGFWFAVTLMAATSASLYAFFKRRRWI